MPDADIVAGNSTMSFRPPRLRPCECCASNFCGLTGVGREGCYDVRRGQGSGWNLGRLRVLSGAFSHALCSVDVAIVNEGRSLEIINIEIPVRQNQAVEARLSCRGAALCLHSCRVQQPAVMPPLQ